MEIERKFVSKKLPKLEYSRTMRADTIYVSTNPEIRIRRLEIIQGKDKGHVDYLITIKGDGDICREEIETYVDAKFYNKMLKFVGKPEIEKILFEYEYKDKIIEFSIIDPGSKTEYVCGEVEFDTIEEANEFEWPFQDFKDETYNPYYKMKNYWIRTRLEV